MDFFSSAFMSPKDFRGHIFNEFILTLFYFTGDHSANKISPKLEVYMVLNDDRVVRKFFRGGKFKGVRLNYF